MKFLHLAEYIYHRPWFITPESHASIRMVFERALATDARIIGVNNRNLKSFTVDLATTEQLAEDLLRPADLLAHFIVRAQIQSPMTHRPTAIIPNGSSVIRPSHFRRSARSCRIALARVVLLFHELGFLLSID